MCRGKENPGTAGKTGGSGGNERALAELADNERMSETETDTPPCGEWTGEVHGLGAFPVPILCDKPRGHDGAHVGSLTFFE